MTGAAPVSRIAVLYADRGGVYGDRLDVDLWDAARDARRYAGPYPVVAHPPCERWCILAPLVESQHGFIVGDDGGCFEAALNAVRAFGGVLEHPALSFAWAAFNLPRPCRHGWVSSMGDEGWSTEVSQVAYGHRARKRTWLYYVGDHPPLALDWSEPPAETIVSDVHSSSERLGRGERVRMYKAEAQSTPPAFAEALLDLAHASRLAVPRPVRNMVTA